MHKPAQTCRAAAKYSARKLARHRHMITIIFAFACAMSSDHTIDATGFLFIYLFD